MKTLSELAKSRITIISGPYGAGKTNIAVNLALSLAAQGRECRLADLDIVNPYFRSADNRVLLEGSGVETLVPEFANTNVDIPALPANYNRLFTGTGHSVADVGGDPDGAAVLGLSHDEYIAAGYTMYFVYNRYRPLTALPEDALARYNPRLSDPVKYFFNNQEYEKDRSQYAKLWLSVGMRKPLSYLNAWLMTSYGFWYPDTVINVYAGNSVFTFTYKDCSYFGYEVEEPGVRASKIPWLDEAYRRLSLEIQQEKIPVLSMLYSPGCLFWCFAFFFSYALYRRKYHILQAYVLVLLMWLTVILGPTYLPRYVLIFWYALPLFVAVMFEEERFGCKNSRSMVY